MHIDENNLTERIREGKEDAFKYIFDQHYQVMCFVASQYLHDDIMAEGVAIDLITHIWEHRQDFLVQPDKLRGYLIKGVRNSCLDYLKSKYHQQELNSKEIGEAYYVSTDDNGLGRLLEKELEGEINKAIMNLPDSCRQVFIMSRIEGKSREKIASELGISINTVKYHLKNALSLLSNNLEKYLIFLLLFVNNI